MQVVLTTAVAVLLFAARVSCDASDPPYLIRRETSTTPGKSWDLSTCIMPKNAYNKTWEIGHFFIKQNLKGCTTYNERFPWVRLNSYRSGGYSRSHWKYIEQWWDYDDCLNKGWLYYARDGKTLIAKAEEYTLIDHTHYPWCATHGYQSGGLRGYQWDYCINCTMVIKLPPPGATTAAPEPTTTDKNIQA